MLLPHLLPLAAEFDPENTGGAMLLGDDGVCVISHGSSNATAMMNAVRVAHDWPRGAWSTTSRRPCAPTEKR